MGIFWGNKNKDKEKLALVFDFGSSSVGGALFWTQKSGVPRMVFSTREQIVLEKNINPDRFLFLAIKSLEIVANRIYSMKLGAPETVFCVLSSSWYVSQTRIIKLEKNAPFVFTAELADSLIQKEIALFEEDHLVKYLDTKSPAKLIEMKNIKTMLNGYETSIPLDQKIKELEMTIFISMSPEQILKLIKKTINRYFHFGKIKFSSFVLASFAVIRNLRIDQENFILIDIGGEVTDIAMAKKNILRDSISFPLGFNFMIRGVASLLNCSLSEAKSYFSLFKDGHATKSVAKKLGPIIDKLKMEWLLKFQESLSNLSNDISIPSIIYITVEKDLAEFFSEIIRNEQFNQYTLAESKFEVVFLDANVFHGLVVFQKNVIRDPSLIIDSVYINQFLIDSIYSTKRDEIEPI